MYSYVQYTTISHLHVLAFCYIIKVPYIIAINAISFPVFKYMYMLQGFQACNLYLEGSWRETYLTCTVCMSLVLVLAILCGLMCYCMWWLPCFLRVVSLLCSAPLGGSSLKCPWLTAPPTDLSLLLPMLEWLPRNQKSRSKFLAVCHVVRKVVPLGG